MGARFDVMTHFPRVLLISAAHLVSMILFSRVGYSQGSFDPTAEAFAAGANLGAGFAQAAGEASFGDAIQHGDVLITSGTPPPGDFSTTDFLPNGTPVIIIDPSLDFDMMGACLLHEWQHLKNGDPRPDNGSTATPQEEQARACAEAAATCAVIADFYAMWTEDHFKLCCSTRATLLETVAWEQLWCALGFGALGPPGPDPCSPFISTSLPCE
jgi:hypothetical protein